jgi:L,D-transpeptidase ErfK/SrfK
MSFLLPDVHSEEKNRVYGKPTFHQVEKGEFLYKIALQYNCSYPAVGRANGIRNANEVRAGMKLTIPSFMILPMREKDEGIVINLPEFRMYHFRSSEEVKAYPLCIGLTTWQTPRGQFEIVNRVINPTWYMNNEMADRLHVKKEIIPPGPLNPLGDRWIGTSLKHIGIHSTNQPMSIGRALSHGCMRLYPDSAKEFFEAVRLKEKGKVIYEPVKLTVWQDQVYLEVHEDVYDLTKDYKKEFLDRAGLLQINPDHLDKEALEKSLTQKRGIPEVIGRIQKD